MTSSDSGGFSKIDLTYEILNKERWQKILGKKKRHKKSYFKKRKNHSVLLESFPTEILKEMENMHYHMWLYRFMKKTWPCKNLLE